MTKKNLQRHLFLSTLIFFLLPFIAVNPAQATNTSPEQDSFIFQRYCVDFDKNYIIEDLDDPNYSEKIEKVEERDNMYSVTSGAMNFIGIRGTYTSEEPPEITISSPYAEKELIYTEESPDVTVDKEKKIFTLIIDNSTFGWKFRSGASCLYFDVNGERITLITKNSSRINEIYPDYFTEMYLFDETKEAALSDSADFVRKEKKSVQEYTLESSTKAVSVHLFRDFEHIDQQKDSSLQGYRWISLGENYVSINGEEPKRFANSSDSLGVNRSPALYLKKGLNIIEVQSSWGIPAVSNGSGITGVAGSGDGRLYLIDWDGEEDSNRPEPSKNTAIKYLDVSRLGNAGGGAAVPFSQYTVGKMEGSETWTAVIPVSAPEANNQQYKQLLVGILPEDPEAQWEIVSPEITEKDGIRLGIYQAVTVEDDTKEIVVEINGERQSITLNRASSEINLTDLGITGASLLNYDDGTAASFDPEQTYYAFSADGSITVNPAVPESMTCKVNGKSLPATFGDKDNLLDVEFTAADGVTKKNYYLFRRKADGTIPALTIPESKNGNYVLVETITNGDTTTYTDSGLDTGKNYYYKVHAYRTVDGQKVTGDDSATKGAKPALSKPALKATAGAKKAVLKWNKVSGANGYIVYSAASKNGKYKAVKTIKKAGMLTFTQKKLKKGKTYYYKVRAYRTVGGKKVMSPESAIQNAKIK